MTVTKEKTIEFWEFLKNYYNIKIIDKNDSSSMKMVGWFLDAIGILDKENFLKQFTTTINQRIYVPFKIGEGNEEQLWGQIRTGVHEVIHAQQAKKEGFVTFSYHYVSNKNKRAEYEAEAYRSEMVLDWARKGSFRQPSEIVQSLKSYGVGKKQIDFAQKYLEVSIPGVKMGSHFNDVTKMGLFWLKANKVL